MNPRPSQAGTLTTRSCSKVGFATAGQHEPHKRKELKPMLQQVHTRRIISLSLGATRKFELRLNWPEAGRHLESRLLVPTAGCLGYWMLAGKIADVSLRPFAKLQLLKALLVCCRHGFCTILHGNPCSRMSNPLCGAACFFMDPGLEGDESVDDRTANKRTEEPADLPCLAACTGRGSTDHKADAPRRGSSHYGGAYLLING